MLFRNLKQLGFSNYHPISLRDKESNLFYIKNLPRTSGVYAVVADKKIKRIIGESNIVYIGKTKNIRNRIKTLFKYLIPENSYRITYNHTAREDMMRILKEMKNYKLSIAYLEHEEPRDAERKLLTAYRKNHIETPPLNNQRK